MRRPICFLLTHGYLAPPFIFYNLGAAAYRLLPALFSSSSVRHRSHKTALLSHLPPCAKSIPQTYVPLGLDQGLSALLLLWRLFWSSRAASPSQFQTKTEEGSFSLPKALRKPLHPDFLRGYTSSLFGYHPCMLAQHFHCRP